MNARVLALLLAAVLAGCGSSNPTLQDGAVDAAPAVIDAPLDAAGVCDPLAAPGQQGCGAGAKCTWITLQDAPDAVGVLGCVPDGTAGLGQACTAGPAGATTGYDDCAAGGVCANGLCRDLCGFDSGAASACEAGTSCTRYAGLGANAGDEPVIGACTATCDPLTQTRVVGGQTTTCGAGRGCYPLVSAIDTIAVCGSAGTLTHDQAITGTTYANSCAPGYVPRRAVQGQPGNECTSLCKPAPVTMGMNEAAEGGDATFTNYASLPATCESAGGPTVRPEVAGTGESCQYVWTREPATHLTAFSNTLGWCFDHASWAYDPDGMDPIENTAAYPRCITLTTGDVVPPVDAANPGNDALYFGCVPLPTMLQAAMARALAPPRAVTPTRLDQLAGYRR